MRRKIKVVNLEAGMPTAEVAQKRLGFEIVTAKREGCIALKIIHGYGSKGTGGRLKEAVGKMLASRKAEGAVRAFVGGEEWSIFNAVSRDILNCCTELRNDQDLDKGNAGITILLL